MLQPMVLAIEPKKKGSEQPGGAHYRQISNHGQGRLADFGPALHDEVENDDRHKRQGGFHRGHRHLHFVPELVPGHDYAACETQPRELSLNAYKDTSVPNP